MLTKPLFRIILAAALVALLALAGLRLLKPNLGPDNLSANTPNTITYSNTKYNYSLSFPNSWFIDYYGDTKETARGISLVSNQADLTSGDGGPPLEVKTDIFIHDLKELSSLDSSFPHIKSVQDWINWERTYQVSFDSEALGPPQDEPITVSGQSALKTSWLTPLYPEDMGQSIRVTVLDPTHSYIFQIQYTGRQPFFDNYLQKFDQIVNSFHLQ